MTITRGFRSAEFERLYLIEKTCFAYGRYSQPRLRKALQQGIVLVARFRGRPVGYLHIEPRTKYAYISSVAVLPGHQGKGIAGALMQRAEKALRRPQWLLHVRAENPAQKLYFNLGYRVVQFVKDYYGHRQHGLKMRKTSKRSL